MKKFQLLLALSILLFSSCDDALDIGDEKVIAQAYESYLFQSDLDADIPQGLSPEDSARFAKSYIENWILNSVLYQKAKLNLSENSAEIEKMVEEYRQSRYVYAYEQLLLDQKLDTTFKEEKLLEIFNQREGDFILDEPIFKLFFVQVPKDAPKQEALKMMLVSDDEEDIFTLKDYCYQYAYRYFFGEKWISLSDISKQLPYEWGTKNYFNTRNNIVLSDSVYNYVVKVNDYIIKGEKAPFEFAQEEIKKLLLQKRKLNLISKTRKTLVDEAKAKGAVSLKP